MTDKELVDALVVSEYHEFEEDPLGYVADRDEAVSGLVSDGAAEGDALDAWGEFERRYLVLDGGGLTFSSHGVDRARTLGETVYLDNTVQSAIMDALEEDGRTPVGGLSEEVGEDTRTVEHNVWLLRRRGVVEVMRDAYEGDRAVALDEG